MPFSGFPRGTRYTPVPNPLLGPLLESIDNLLELKCALRAIWWLHHARGYPRLVLLSQLRSDPVLTSTLKDLPPSPQQATGDAIVEAMDQAVRRGIFLATQAPSGSAKEPTYLLNTEANRKRLADLGDAIASGLDSLRPSVRDPQPAPPRPNIFALYEENIGMLTPLLADELREAEDTYPAQWIEDAIKLTVEANKRNWRYVTRILERWAAEGKDHGESGRHPQKDNRQRYLEDYLQRRGALPGAGGR